MVISVKNRKFSRSPMTKAEYFTIFLGDKPSVTSGTRFLQKSRKLGNGLG